MFQECLRAQITVAILAVFLSSTSALECSRRDYGFGSPVCVCNSQYCDTITRPTKTANGQLLTYTSSKSGMRFTQDSGTFQKTPETLPLGVIHVNSEKKFQTIIGWGGAFTDSTGYNIQSLSEDTRNFLLDSYFSQQGLEYNLGRVPIGGTDFSQRAYSYDDGPVDPSLANFNLTQEDFNFKLPIIKKANQIAGNNLKLLAAAWTAPKWMKSNGKYTGGTLIKTYYQTWVDYFVKFFDAYKTAGVEFWAVSTGNEPSLALTGPFDKVNTVGWNPSEQAGWIAQNLGPTIRNSQYSHLKILALDDQTPFLPILQHTVLGNKNAAAFIDGIAVHWYLDAEIITPLALKSIHGAFPEKFLINTESSIILGNKKLQLGYWKDAETYAYKMINELSNYVAGWIDWNLALDLNGGPSYISNFLDAAIIVNATSDEFYKQPIYYALGQFAKFIPAQSVKIETTSQGNWLRNLHVIGFQRPDNGTAIVILNKSHFSKTVKIFDATRGLITLKVVEKSITTVLYW